MKTRFEIMKGEGKRCAWVVQDHNSPRLEDARLYFFTSLKKAKAFYAMMIAENGNTFAPRDNPA